ncbi:MAG: type II toxin-antitoxin system prevent-host-death family antitoxin [Mariprofundaceae bacterium]|nr:type II toxin-antitoxin system prevent-host-death family antitoxin [Mariprofundaceae bacterium]
MQAVTYSALHANLSKAMQQVCEAHEPIIVTRQKADSVVVMSLEDYDGLRETCHLMSNPRNAMRLMQSIEELT